MRVDSESVFEITVEIAPLDDDPGKAVGGPHTQ